MTEQTKWHPSCLLGSLLGSGSDNRGIISLFLTLTHRRSLFCVARCQLSIPSTKGTLVFADILGPLPVAKLGPCSQGAYRCQDPGKTGRQHPKDKNTRPACSFSGKQQVALGARQRGSVSLSKVDLCLT